MKDNLVLTTLDPLEVLETRFDTIWKEAQVLLKEKKFDGIKVESNLGKVESKQFILTIPDAKDRESAIFKLETNEIPLTPEGNRIHTTISGASLVTESLSPQKQENLMQTEKEIQKRVSEKLGIETLSRIENHKDYKWAVAGENIANTYYFKNLTDCKESLEKGLIKSSYELVNIPQWRLPTTLPHQWEFPNTMKHVIAPEDKSPTVIIDGGDELAMALSSSGIPDLLAYGIQSTLLYPFFISVLRIGYDGAAGEEKEHRELLEENLEAKKELRGMLVDSLVRETKIKEELSRKMENHEPMEKDSETYQLVSALSKEGIIRDSLGVSAKQLSNEKNNSQGARDIKDNLEKIQTEVNKIQEENKKLISKKTLENLSDKKFYKYMVENGTRLSASPEVYGKFIDALSKYKQVSDKTFLRKTQRYIQTQMVKNGMGWMWMAMAAFEANAIMKTIGSTGVKLPGAEAIGGVLENVGSGLAVAGQAAMVIYGISKTGEGIHTVRSLNDWIKKINQSDIIDKHTKTLITDYMKSRRTHTIIGDCVGSTMLSAGQVMMILGGPAGGLGPTITFPGAGLTILGVGITLTNNMITTKNFHINDVPSKIEKDILKDNTSLPKGGLKEGESQYQANLRWKSETLKSFSEQKQKNLLWVDIYSEIIKVCQNKKEPTTQDELQKITNTILKQMKGNYSYKFNENMKSLATDTLAKVENEIKLKESINMFYHNKPGFYHKILHEELLTKPEINIAQCLKANETLNKASTHSKYSETSSLVNELKETGLWDESRRKVTKRMVINKKSRANIRGAHFEPYLKTISAKQDRYLQLPSPVPDIHPKFKNTFLQKVSNFVYGIFKPLINMKFKIPLNPEKHKTIYVFKEDDFKKDMANYKNLEPKRKDIMDEVLKTLVEERNNSVARTIVTQGNFRVKSDVYRPLWMEIPQLVYRERMDKEVSKAGNMANDKDNSVEALKDKLLRKNESIKSQRSAAFQI